MSHTKIGIKQYEDLRKSQEAGDTARVERILALGYQPDYIPTMADEVKTLAPITPEPAVVELDTEAILGDIDAGLENKEITEKYGISAQKLSSIKKGAK